MPYMPPQYDFNGNSTAITGSTPAPGSADSQLMSFEDFYKQKTGYNVSPYGLAGRIDNFFTGKTNSAEQEYKNYVADYEHKRNQAETSAANQLTFAREDSQIQRLIADYKAAGLNPYALLSGGNLSSGVVSSPAQKSSYKRGTSKGSDKANGDGSKVISSAIRAIAFIAMMAA